MVSQSNYREGTPTPSKALLVGVYTGNVSKELCHEHLNELERLADTYGVETIEKVAAPLRSVDVATFIGKGKVEELSELIEEKGIDIVIFDDEVSPAQQRNLEKRFKKTVMDRTELILGVFDIHARTHEARLQIELAQARYLFPRLKRMWTHLSRQVGGAGGYLKGEGEKQIEIDRRLLQTQVAKIERELKEVRKHRETQRKARQRSGIPSFAIVGYTNAGKSTLLNALTDAGVLAEDQLFATLDTTTRKFTLPNNQEILLIDTVGFIRKLPHQLVAAFKSTLEEAAYADILLHLIDVSHPAAMEQAESSQQVLKELHADDRPLITVLNKVDRALKDGTVERMRLKFPRTVQVSATERIGFDQLTEMMIQVLDHLRQEVTLCIPQSEYAKVSRAMEQGEIISQEYEGNDVILRVRLPREQTEQFREYLVT